MVRSLATKAAFDKVLADAGPTQAVVVGLLIAGQLLAMVRLVRQPEALAPWYNGTGVTAYVSCMMVTATALPGLLT